MLSEDVKETIRAYLEKDIEETNSNLYFNLYTVSKGIDSGIAEKITEGVTGSNKKNSPVKELDSNGYLVRVESEPILFWELSNDRLLIVYSSAVEQSIRRQLEKLPKRFGWVLESWIPTETINSIYNEYSPDEESVNLERRWDPYWVYQRESEIPDGLLEYYNNNTNKFVEREIEFNIKTPKWLVDKALKEGMQKDLLDKSEISESRFKFQVPDDKIRQDGGVQSATIPQAGVTVRQQGDVVHRSGDSEATFELLSEIDRRNTIYSEFETIVPKEEYSEKDNGIIEIQNYRPGRILKIRFPNREYNEEASIMLLNFFTVGQSDVELHGFTESSGDLWFFAQTHLSYDNGEHEVLFTQEDQNPTVYIRPVSSSTSGLVYIYKKLREKYDSRVERDIVDEFPEVLE